MKQTQDRSLRCPSARQLAWATLFYIGLATPASTLVQITLCGVYFVYTIRKQRRLPA